MKLLGYKSQASFHKTIQKAISACTSLNISILENFIQEEKDFKLSRFACYLVAMNGDSKKPEVAMAQTYFAKIAEAFKRYVEEAEDFERILVRDEISEHEKTLNSTAKQAGVTNYAFFQDSGYRGLYNMSLKNLRSIKGIKSNRTPLDFMGKEELAANLFRVTQTEAKIRNEGIRGQKSAESTAYEVGKKVRNTIEEINGTMPENLPITEDIKKVKSSLKSSQREFAKIDKPKGT